MKPLLINLFTVLFFLFSGNTYAEIIFKNCNLSPNTGMTDFYIYLEKGEIEIRDQDDIRIFAIDDNQNSKVSSSRLIGWPSMSEFNNATRDSQILFLNSMNDQVDEQYELDYSTGLVKQVYTTHPGADQEIAEAAKQGIPFLETNCRVVNLYQKQEKKVSTNQLKKINSISTQGLTKKQKKKYKKYMAKPEIKLCINYINNYGWFDDQSVRWVAIQNRGIDCNQYKDLARFEDEKRNRIAESGKKLLDTTVDGVYGTTESNSSKKRTHCRTTNVGGVVQVFCNEY